MKFPTENPRKPGNMDPPPVAVQTNLVPPKKVQPGMLQSSLVHASVATMQNPMGCTLPRLSVSSRPPSMVASMEAVADGSAPFTMMKLKTVLAVFVVVVAYLVAGGLVFRALEQPFENNQKITITAEKAAFLQKHPCVSPDELEAVIKAESAFNRLKNSFVSAPVLILPDQATVRGGGGCLRPWKLAVISQRAEKDDKLHPHAFLSHRCCPAERNYDVGTENYWPLSWPWRSGGIGWRGRNNLSWSEPTTKI